MDLICARCGEPWAFDALHDEAVLRFTEEYGETYASSKHPDRTERYNAVFARVSDDFRHQGCGVAFRLGACERVESDRTAIAGEAYELLGDDIDGAAAMMEDYGV